MGLDMYLRASKYVAGYNWGKDEAGEFSKTPEPKFTELLDYAGLEPSDIREELPSGNIEFTIAYWRKVNCIHGWFVENCAQGEDDCRPVYVSREKLEELHATITEVLASGEDAEVADELLPVHSGFFFGDTSYGEWYWSDLREAEETLRGILTNSKFTDWEFEYQASW